MKVKMSMEMVKKEEMFSVKGLVWKLSGIGDRFSAKIFSLTIHTARHPYNAVYTRSSSLESVGFVLRLLIVSHHLVYIYHGACQANLESSLIREH